MGSTNPTDVSEIRRRMAARDVLSNTLPRSGRDSASSRFRRDGTAGLALSGRTTTARGHVIVPPTQARLIAFQYEHVPDNDSQDDKTPVHSDVHSDNDEEKYHSRTVTVMMSGRSNHNNRSNVNPNSERGLDSPSPKTARATTGSRYEFNSIGQNESFQHSSASDGSRRDNNANKAASSEADKSTLSREHHRIDRNHRSVSSAATLGTVTATTSEVPSGIAGLRAEYEVKKQNRFDAQNTQNLNRAQRVIATTDDAGQARTGRRRRGRPSAQSNEQLAPSSKQSNSSRKPVTSYNALGNATNARRKYSPYPAYIQPVIEENSSYQSTGNHMLYHRNQGVSYDVQRSRKISTEMNRYESSSSSSSSSSGSDHESPNRPVTKQAIESVAPARNLNPATPDTSDAEKKKPGQRRRRRRRGIPASAKQDPNDGYHLTNPVTSGLSTRGRAASRMHGGIGRRRQPNVIPLLEDKYVSLPDNYKPSEYRPTANSVGDGDMAQLTEATNSQGDVREEHSNPGTKSLRSSQRDAGFEHGPRSVEVIESGSNTRIPAGLRRKSDFPPSTNADQLIITKDEKLGHRRAASSTSNEISYSEERLDPNNVKSGRGDFAVSTPDLHRPNRVGGRASHNSGNTPEEHFYVGRGRKNSLGGESRVLGDLKNKFDKSDAPKGDLGQSYVKPFQQGIADNKSDQGSSRNVYEDPSAVVQSQPRLKARKVGECFWPPDESTKQLLSHSSAAPRNVSSSAASVTMQETIDQLHSFANKETPIKSRSNSITGLAEYSRSHESGESTSDLSLQSEAPKLGRKGSSNRSSGGGLSRVQMVKTAPMDVSSPIMSSTETLKECGSSGEHQDKTSRSPSIDSTASNPEIIVHNASGIKDRNARSKVVYASRSTPIKEELFIVEKGQDLPSPCQPLERDPAKNNTKSSEELSNKTMAEQFKGLTVALKNFTKSLPNAPIEKATLRQDAVLTVSPKGNVTCQPPKLETVTEHPDSSEVDEGIVTEVESNKDPKSFLKLDEHLEESNRRNKRSLQKDSDSNGNESARSLSDPSANRKRSQPSAGSMDSNFFSALGRQEDMGSFEHPSISSSSQISENPSSYSDTLNIEELISEERESDDTEKIQTKSTKKHYVNPGGSAIITRPVVRAGSSEPHITEQKDTIGDLDRFKDYRNAKVLTTLHEKTPVIVEEPLYKVYADNSYAHVSQRNSRPPTLKAKIRQQNGGSSIMGQLMAEMTPPINEEVRAYETNTRSSSTSSLPASEESSPVQKHRPAVILGSEDVEQFNRMYDSMLTTSKSGSDTPPMATHAPVVHSRSNSEPVHTMMKKNDRAQSHEAYQEQYSNRGRRAGMVGLFQPPSMGSVGTIPQDVSEPRTFIHAQSEDPVFSPQKESFVFAPIQEKGKAHHDMRLHAFRNLRDTEESYVSSLRILYQDYMTPLKHPENHSTCEPRLVDEMFYKIPQLFQHHEKFYENVEKCYQEWDYKEVRLGELFLNSFNENALLETYTAYITNYLNAREAVRNAEEKEAFRRFMEQCRAENKEKQGLADLMIKPVQRIPRYELLIKDMLKHTPEGHPDREGLLIAQKEIHKLAIQMNRSEKEAELAEKQDRLLTDLEQLIEGLVDLSVPKRRFLRQDIVTEIKGQTKKDRSIWLFTDLIVCSTRKGRTGTFRRGSMWNLNMGQDKYSSIDLGYKYKFLWKFPLEDVENLKSNTLTGRHVVDKQLQTLQNDMEVLVNMQKQAGQVECNHVQLDEALREIITYIGRQIAEKKVLSTQPICPSGRVELGISTGDGLKTFLFEFLSDDNKVQFEKLFATAKRSLTTLKNRWEPTFAKAIPISRTRAGMQFSCAASNVDASPDVKEVWVCNTDGYVGQVCFLTLEPEPNQTQCITVCHAKICCIAQVPAWERRLVPAQTLIQEVAKGTIVQPAAVSIMAWDDDLDDSDEENTSPHSTRSGYSSSYSQSPYSTMNGGRQHQRTKKFSLDSWLLDMRFRQGDDISLPIMSPLIDSPLLRRRFGFGRLDRQLAASQPAIFHPLMTDPRENADLVSLPGNGGGQGGAWSKGSDGSTLHGSLEDFLQENETVVGDAQSILAGKDSMWLGTEDGKIHIYPSSQSTRGSKHCVRVRHSAAVHCILYHEGQVFVALSNGDLVVYTRNLTTGEWDFENGKTKAKISSPYAITKMVVVLERKELWCGCQNMIKIVSIKDLMDNDVAVTNLMVTNDNKRQIYCMVNCGYGVWVALDKRPQIKLYHTVTHDLLADIDVSTPVSKMLASADAIIRQHKAACLRITALLVCNDLLWVGTSAGVVLTLTLPKITTHTSSLAMPVMPQGLAYGHTGHVRFLACAELSDKENLSRGGSRRASASTGKRRSSSSSNASNPSRAVSVIISGGDGYEDFRMNSTSESAGRDDSTNHLLVWRV